MMFEKIKENPMYLAEPPSLIDYCEEDFFEEDYNEKYNMLFENIIEENREFLDYEKYSLEQLLRNHDEHCVEY